MYLINLSGHPTMETTIAPLVGVNMISSDGDLMAAQLEEVLNALPMAEELRCGAAATIIPPGYGAAGMQLVAIWHGLFGSFPTIQWKDRTDEGFVFTDKSRSDLSALRLEVRSHR